MESRHGTKLGRRASEPNAVECHRRRRLPDRSPVREQQRRIPCSATSRGRLSDHVNARRCATGPLAKRAYRAQMMGTKGIVSQMLPMGGRKSRWAGTSRGWV